MSEPELALALSARDWTDRLHRFLADHGGARVRVNAMSPEDLTHESFDVLLIDDSCSFLTPRLVMELSASGRRVIGVFDPDEFADGKTRLRECGVVDVIEAYAHPDEFLDRIASVAEEMTIGRQEVPVEPAQQPASRLPDVLVVAGCSGGVGVTEVAVGIAGWLTEHRLRVVLVDADRSHASLAQRLGLAPYPNLATALDLFDHSPSDLASALQTLDGSRMVVLAGVPPGADLPLFRPRQIADLVGHLGGMWDAVVVDAGTWSETDSSFPVSLIADCTRLVGVGTASPVGLSRMIDWTAEVARVRGAGVDLVINRAPRQRYHRAELVEEFTRAVRPRSLALISTDEAVEQAAWNGTVVGRSRFGRSLDSWLAVMLGVK